MKYPEKADPRGQKAAQCLLGLGERKRRITAYWYRVSFWGDEHVLELYEVVIVNIVNVLNATELFTVQCLILHYMNFNSTKILYE